MNIKEFIINSNLYIAIAAVFLTIETQIQLGLNPQFHPYLLLIFFATLFEYNLHRLITIFFYRETLRSNKHDWVSRNQLLFYSIVSFSVIGFVITIFNTKFSVLLALSPIALITLFYSTPVSKIGKTLFRLRQIPLVKIFLIAFVWAMVTILLPLVYEGSSLMSENVLFMLTERFLFVLAITIPFDIRDIEADKHDGLKTIPALIGKHYSIRLGVGILCLFILISFIHYCSIGQISIAIAMMLSGLMTIFALASKRIQSLPFYHYGILDGTMIVQAILVLIAHKINLYF